MMPAEKVDSLPPIATDPVPVQIVEAVPIPSLDRRQFTETVHVVIPAFQDPDGEIYWDTDADRIVERTKARHIGLLTKDQIKALRQRLGLTQKQICLLLQIGMKTWTRWENGRERPFRSINVLLRALHDGKLDLPYLEALAGLSNPGTLKSGTT